MSSRIECAPPLVVADLTREELLAAELRACTMNKAPLRLAAQKSTPHAPLAPIRSAPA